MHIKSFMIFFIFLSFSIVIGGCSQKQPIINKESNRLLFAQEDFYILSALRAEELHNFETASTLFQRLFEKTQRKEYLYRFLKNEFKLQHYQKILKKIETIEQKDVFLEHMRIIVLVNLQKLQKAEDISFALALKTKEIEDILLYSEILVKRKKYNEAKNYLESVYVKNYNEKILEKLTFISYTYLQEKKEAIQKLQKHLKVYGCSKILCLRLSAFYFQMNDIESLLKIYLQLYAQEKNEAIAKKIEEIYLIQKDFIHLSMFLENSHSDDKTLFLLYVNANNYIKASQLAKKLYEASGDVVYLAQSAIYEYEGSKEKNTKQFLKHIVQTLEDVIVQDPQPLYLNYLGYLLIDHELDVKRGIKYVKDALQKDPESLYFLDSLAWGYFKQGKCIQADRLMQKVVQLEYEENKEVKEHLEAIQNCLQD